MSLKFATNLFLGKYQGGSGSSSQVALLSITTAPSGSFAVGSKYYNSSTKKIVTAVTEDTWTGATSADPVFNTIYTFNSGYYIWDGDNLVTTDLDTIVRGVEVDGVSVVDRDKIAQIPKASASILGVVKIGNGINSSEDGTISVSVESVPNVIYFSPAAAGTGDGSSWANAKAFSQAAYDAMTAGYTALLLKGTYTLSATFTTAAGKDIIGGFTGLELMREKPHLVRNGSYADDLIDLNPAATVFVPSGFIQGMIANSNITGLVFKGFQTDVDGIALKNNGQIVRDCLAISISRLPAYGSLSVFYSENYDSRFINCVVSFCSSGLINCFKGEGGFIGCRAANIIVPNVGNTNIPGVGFFVLGYYSFLTNCIAENIKNLNNVMSANGGAGFYCPSTTYLRNCKAINCTTGGSGAGFLSGGDTQLFDCEAIGCIASGAENRGGGFTGGHLTRCVARDCAVFGTSNNFGGGFAEATLTDCVAINCYAPSQPAAGWNMYTPLSGVTEINCYAKRTTVSDLISGTPSLYFAYANNDYVFGTIDSLGVTNVENSVYETTITFISSASWTGITLPAGTKYIGTDPTTLVSEKTYRCVIKNSIIEIKEII